MRSKQGRTGELHECTRIPGREGFLVEAVEWNAGEPLFEDTRPDSGDARYGAMNVPAVAQRRDGDCHDEIDWTVGCTGVSRNARVAPFTVPYPTI